MLVVVIGGNKGSEVVGRLLEVVCEVSGEIDNSPYWGEAAIDNLLRVAAPLRYGSLPKIPPFWSPWLPGTLKTELKRMKEGFSRGLLERKGLSVIQTDYG